MIDYLTSKIKFLKITNFLIFIFYQTNEFSIKSYKVESL